jgi:hypothetical protein
MDRTLGGQGLVTTAREERSLLGRSSVDPGVSSVWTPPWSSQHSLTMTAPTTWARLRKRIARYEQAADAQPDVHGVRASVNLRHLQTLRAVIELEIDREILRAREQGASCSDIDYGSSEQAAQQRHAAALARKRQ